MQINTGYNEITRAGTLFAMNATGCAIKNDLPTEQPAQKWQEAFDHAKERV